jgi:hypothetical protein
MLAMQATTNPPRHETLVRDKYALACVVVSASLLGSLERGPERWRWLAAVFIMLGRMQGGRGFQLTLTLTLATHARNKLALVLFTACVCSEYRCTAVLLRVECMSDQVG